VFSMEETETGQGRRAVLTDLVEHQSAWAATSNPSPTLLTDLYRRPNQSRTFETVFWS
jgi:hypothetical protein